MLNRDGEIRENLPINHSITVKGKRIVLYKANGVWKVWVR